MITGINPIVSTIDVVTISNEYFEPTNWLVHYDLFDPNKSHSEQKKGVVFFFANSSFIFSRWKKIQNKFKAWMTTIHPLTSFVEAFRKRYATLIIPLKINKIICSYPDDIIIDKHCIVKLLNTSNENEITLLSFGGNKKHTLIIKYISIWDEKNVNKKNYNQWIPFIDNKNNSIILGEDNNCDYVGARAVIGGSNNHLLFISYHPNNIDIFDLNTFQYIKHDIFSTKYSIRCHNFFLISKKNEMLLFDERVGLSIQYDENNNNFKFNKIQLCNNIKLSSCYGCVHLNNFILFFGGFYYNNISNEIYKYSITKNKWTKLEQILSIRLCHCVALLNSDNTFIHIIGFDGEELSHIKAKVNELIKDEEEEEEEEEKGIIEDKEIMETEEIAFELYEMKQGLNIKKLKPKYFKPFKEFKGHCDQINSIKISPDGTKIVSSSNDKTIKIWDITSGIVIKQLIGHEDNVNDAEFSPDGNLIVSCSSDKTIRLWDVISCIETKILQGHNNNATRIMFSKDGKIIISASSRDETIKIWDVISGQEIQTLKGKLLGKNDVKCSSNDNQQIIVSFECDIIEIWDIQSSKIIKKCNYANGVQKAEYSFDGRFIVSISTNGIIQIWDVKSEILVNECLNYDKNLNCIKYFPNGQTLVMSCSSKSTIQLWDTKLGIEIQ
ncbi:WD-40 repeat-containing protein [Reticulomyxa filosa]|uniref:WD-40 repeat-containing protein n=1 Tax=Reticulomyxa filosa TaxID=46433 RepID=X6MCX1_RETFI|nr:WD-40 repeat-containing protein [Reticulomyxa filosa]|eukprot:ETO11858.1 WD-40 repeat-containing protein [Reticulomyxa filosa]